MLAQPFRLRKHADFQRVYKTGRKQTARQMSFFYTLRPALGPDGLPFRQAPHQVSEEAPRVGLTVGKVLGKAVDRNRIKRRLRAAVRAHLPLLRAPVDVILHPRRSALDTDFATLEREVAHIFRGIQKAVERPADRPGGGRGGDRTANRTDRAEARPAPPA